MARSSLAPRQRRSRESEKKLMQATVEVLGRFGLEGTNIPRVAECAGLTPGAVYRRFADKNALMERVILGVLETQLEHLQQTFTPGIAAKSTLPGLVERLVHGMVASNRSNATLVNAMRQFARNSDHRAFKRKAAELENRTADHLVEVLMATRTPVHHPDPKPALRLAVVSLSGTLMVLFGSDGENRHRLIANDDEWLERELTRMFLGYIGAA